MNQLAAQFATKMDSGLAILLIALTGILCFYLGLMAPFIVIRIAKIFRMEFGEFIEKDDDGE